MFRRAPKTITSHPAVSDVLDGELEGFDYKYDVELKPDYEFGCGRMDGCNSARFHTVADFQQAAKSIRQRR